MSADRYVIQNNSAIHFVTFTIVGWMDLFIRPIYKNVIVDSLNYCITAKGLVVYGWVIMTSHVHLLISSKDGISQSDIIRDFKKFTSKKLVRTLKETNESRSEWILSRFKYAARTGTEFQVWQLGYHGVECDDTIVKAEQRLEYIHQNPVKEEFVTEAEDFVYSSAAAYAGGDSKVNITLLY